MNKLVHNKKMRWIIIASVLIVIFITIILFIIELSLFNPLHKAELTKVEILRYKDGIYHKLTVSDENKLNTLYSMRKSIIKKVTIINSKIRDSEAFQKDGEYMVEFNWENEERQTIEITGNNIIIFNYCSKNEDPKIFLDNSSSNYDISLSRDALTDYILWLYYDNQ